MNKTELIAAIADKAGIAKKDADKALATAEDVLTNAPPEQIAKTDT